MPVTVLSALQPFWLHLFRPVREVLLSSPFYRWPAGGLGEVKPTCLLFHSKWMLDPKSSKRIPFTTLLSQQGWGWEVGSGWWGMTPRWILVRLFSAPSRFCGYVNEHWPERRSSPVCLLNLYIFKQMTSSLGACVGSWTPELLFCCSSDVERSGTSISVLCLLTSGLNRSLLTVSLCFLQFVSQGQLKPLPLRWPSLFSPQRSRPPRCLGGTFDSRCMAVSIASRMMVVCPQLDVSPSRTRTMTYASFYSLWYLMYCWYQNTFWFAESYCSPFFCVMLDHCEWNSLEPVPEGLMPLLSWLLKISIWFSLAKKKLGQH